MGQSQSKSSVVVAIDLGSSYSGYAFSYRNKKKEIILNPNWGAEYGSEYLKAPSSLMYAQDGTTVDYFGIQAERKYFETVEKNNATCKPLMFKAFKRQWYKQDVSTGDSKMVKSEDNRERPALDVFVDALRFLKEHAIHNIKPESGGAPRAKDIQWVVTVPVISSERQRIFMREVCFKAGFISEMFCPNLRIASEPECASLHCKSLSWEGFASLERHQKPELRKGTVFMTVDLGAGTTDITVHKVASHRKIIRIIPQQGGTFGGNDINERFLKLMENAFGQSFINHIKSQKPSLWVRLMQTFEMEKRNFEGDDLEFPISTDLAESYEGYFPGKNIINLPEDSGIQITAYSNMLIHSREIKEIFDDVIDKIVDKIFAAFEETKTKAASVVKYVFLVGGFANSKYVQQAIKNLENTYRPAPKILVPHQADLCILRGAVVLGHKPKEIQSAVSGKTYAILAEKPFNDKRDDKSRMERIDGKLIVKYLDPIIKKGDMVSEGLIKRRKVKIPGSSDYVEQPIYMSDSPDVNDPSAPNVKQLGKVVVTLPDGKARGKAKYIEVEFIFGITELFVRPVDDSLAQVELL